MPLSKNVFEEKTASVLIVAKPGRIRNSLRALLKAAPQINKVNQVDDTLTALQMLQTQQPALIILGSNLSTEQIETTMQQIKLHQPQIRCIILADNTQQQRQAKIAGADSVLLAGFSATALFAVVEDLLPFEQFTANRQEIVNGN